MKIDNNTSEKIYLMFLITAIFIIFVLYSHHYIQKKINIILKSNYKKCNTKINKYIKHNSKSTEIDNELKDKKNVSFHNSTILTPNDELIPHKIHIQNNDYESDRANSYLSDQVNDDTDADENTNPNQEYNKYISSDNLIIPKKTKDSYSTKLSNINPRYLKYDLLNPEYKKDKRAPFDINVIETDVLKTQKNQLYHLDNVDEQYLNYNFPSTEDKRSLPNNNDNSQSSSRMQRSSSQSTEDPSGFNNEDMFHPYS
jgi:hypothetical protein